MKRFCLLRGCTAGKRQWFVCVSGWCRTGR